MKQADPRQIKSKEKLHDAYLKLLFKGQEQFTIQKLCEIANVTRPTFYKIYKDIQELRLDIHKAVLDDLKEALTIKKQILTTEFTQNFIPENLTLLFQHIQLKHIVYETFFIYQPDGTFIKEVKEIIKDFIEEGILLSQSQGKLLPVNLKLLIKYLTGAYVESIIFWIEENYETPIEEMAKSLIEMSLHGSYIPNSLQRSEK
ncbi:TetR/AcrR family transcriptional regulator [Ureibacillus sinduriensis]|uniref:Transcriptional regulator TetR C-terminal Firmicutes type domain-containing protein n=1 Tax=Ureibacillus sinduriensis BLB-1 = JCM 15800 TaxID=1384057 RepID=A0A0A3I406_9BACL|nr:TetR/AcrR family transcriptional regulator C-terminal domain-containing protein [Ureibacillus sinduriensis]KGR79449.1 hypothetical protein CD33_00450 [Ureibacillus sinduriensis BLB-1 = JCM 15800]